MNANRFTVAISLVLFYPPLLFTQTPPVVWVAGSLQRVAPADPAGSGTQMQLWAARGEYESFQIITRAPVGNDITNMSVSVSDLVGPGGQVITKDNLTLYREDYVYIGPNNGSPNWGGSNQPQGPGWYPDGLIPFEDPATGLPISGTALTAVPYNLSASTNQPIWVDVFVPRNAVAGQYTGTYTITSSQGSAGGQILLNVWNFSLPLQPSLKSSFGVWNSLNITTYETLLANRLMPDYGSPYLSLPQQITLTNSYGLSAVDLGFFSGAVYGDCQMSPAPSVSSLQAAVAAQEPNIFLYNFTADEIDGCTNLFSSVEQWARNLHAAGIDNLVTMGPTPELFDDGTGSGRSAVDIWAVLPDTYDADLDNVQLALQKGNQVWSYNTEVQDAYSPKWEIDFAPINFRIQPGFINQSLNLTGLLYWQVDRWSSDPWNNVFMIDDGESLPGEGELVYPGSTVGILGVAPSMRLKWLRDGVDDYDYIQLLKQAGYGDWAMQIVRSIAPDWTNWTRDTNALEAARLRLGQMLDSLAN
ncbi:MAG: glycoside hydrolase domain-containing protein [Bryobacteraceae bacterium]